MLSRANKKKLIILLISLILVAIPVGAFIIREYSLTPQNSSTDALKSLPYLAWHPAEDTIDKVGVIKYDRTKSFEGISIYSPDPSTTCYLIDMLGNILHTWSTKEHRWWYAKMCKNGDLLAITKEKILIRLDWNSNIKWIKKGMHFHHDIAVAENNDIYSMIRKEEWVFKSGLPFPITNDYIIVLSPDGEIKREISIFEVLKKEIALNERINIKIYRRIINFENMKKIVELKKTGHSFAKHLFPDILYTNTIGIIDRDIAGLCKKGDLLICSWSVDLIGILLIGILDIEKEKLIWSWGPGSLDKPHHPTLLENGNILIFDNGRKRKYSRVVEIDPLTKDIVWEYRSNPPGQFYSKDRGSSQRLPNGNTLITESEKGHVFEVTHDGEIVWEFYNPEIRKDKKERATIYRMMRITDPENYPCLEAIIEPK